MDIDGGCLRNKRRKIDRQWRQRVAGLVILAVLLLSGGCATYSSGFQASEEALVHHQPQRALQALEKQSRSKTDRVLYLLNKAALLRMTGEYAASNEAFEKTKQLMTELSALSIREQSTSFIINDASRSYVGEEFEQVLVHLYEALNYIALGKMDDARVEAGQVDLKLRAYQERSRNSSYTEDAFARYLTGIIYEDLGETGDALIAYRNAYEAYVDHRKKFDVDVPPSLKSDLLRLTKEMGLDDEFQRYQAEFKLSHWLSQADLQNKGQMVFILSNGLVPIKRESSALLPNPETGQAIRISLPYYQTRPLEVAYAQVDVAGEQAPTSAVENVGAIAIQSLKDKMPAIIARALARDVVKAKLAKQADNRGDPVLGLLVNIAGIATEIADTRSWLTLPDNIQMARLPLPPGTYTVKVDLLDRSGRVVAVETFPNVVIRKGRMTFLTYHWI